MRNILIAGFIGLTCVCIARASSISGSSSSVSIDLTDGIRTAAATEQISYSSGTSGSVKISCHKLSGRTTNRSGLVHRWSFNGSLEDSVGGQAAEAIGEAVCLDTECLLPGAETNGVSYISLGSNILPTDTDGVTIEIWATHKDVRKWSRVIDIGCDTNNYYMVAWTQSTNLMESATCLRDTMYDDPGLGAFALDTPYHVSIVIARVDEGVWQIRATKRDGRTGALLSATESEVSGWSMANLGQQNCWLGRSQFNKDCDACASYDEVRVWNRALSQNELTESAKRGADDIRTELAIDETAV